MEVGLLNNLFSSFTPHSNLPGYDIHVHPRSGEVLTAVNDPLEQRHNKNDAKYGHTVVWRAYISDTLELVTSSQTYSCCFQLQGSLEGTGRARS